jgi:nicotinamidase-related amidase
MTARYLDLRVRAAVGDRSEEPATERRLDWDPARAAVVICDMWDAHHCVSAADRVAEMAPRMNEVVAGLRAQGALIIHAPGGCADFYRATPARLRAIRAPRAKLPGPVDWNGWDPARESELPLALTDPGRCSCDSADPCARAGPPYPWTRQISTIDIAPEDAITDDGAEVFNLLEERDIADVVVMGVHTNICVLGRPYGIRQLVYWAKKPVLCRDLTDSFHRDPRGHSWGTQEIVAHIERHWCPTVRSDQLVGGAPFRFCGGEANQAERHAGDRRAPSEP